MAWNHGKCAIAAGPAFGDNAGSAFMRSLDKHLISETLTLASTSPTVSCTSRTPSPLSPVCPFDPVVRELRMAIAQANIIAPAAVEISTIRKLQLRILPFVFVLYVVSFLDRINIEREDTKLKLTDGGDFDCRWSD